MKKFWLIVLTVTFSALLLFSGCQAGADTFQPIEGTNYAATINGQEASFVISDNGEKSTLSYTDTNTVTVGDLLGNKATSLDITLCTKNDAVSRCTLQKDGLMKIEYQHSYITLLIDGKDKDTFIEQAKQHCQDQFDKGNLSQEDLTMYQTLLNGKTYHIDITKEVQLWVFGTVDEQNGSFKIKRQEQRTPDGHLTILTEYSDSGVITLKKRFNKAGLAVGVFEYDENGEQKKLTWYNDDGSLMNSEEYVRENGQLKQVVFLSEDGPKSVEFYKDGHLHRHEETYSNGITTYCDYDENGNRTRYSAITGENEEMVRVMEFIVRPGTEESYEIAGTEYDNDGNVTARYAYTYNDNYVPIHTKNTDAKGNILFEEKRDDQDRVIYEFLPAEEIKLYYRYDAKDADRVAEVYDLNGKLVSINKERGEVCFFSLHYDKDGSYTETYSEATASLYHYNVKHSEFDRNGKPIKVTEYEPFFRSNGDLIDTAPTKISVYKDGLLHTVTEYRNELAGTIIIKTPIKISHYEKGVLVSTETYS